MQHFFLISVDNPDDVINNCKSDVTPLDTKDIAFQKEPSYVNDTVRVRIMAELCGMESREDPLYVEDSELYAIHLRTKKLRSFKVPCFLPLSLRYFFVINSKPCFLLVNANLDNRFF